jgi:glutamyl-tRNA reductase
VASSAVSVSYAAVELAKRIFGDMAGHDAMLIGAGEMAELAAVHLLQAGVRRIRIANRTIARAQELAEKIGGEAVPWEGLLDRLAVTDIVISSTGASGAVLGVGEAREVMRRRKQRPLFLIDIALPRDIDPDVNGLDNVYLYDIDDLKEVVEENLAQRRGEALKARAIVDEEAETFSSWLRSLALRPTIVDLVRRGESIVRDELARTYRRLGPVDDATRGALEALGASLVRRFNHDPIAFLKNGMHEAEENAHALENLAVIRRIFQLDQHRPRSETDCSPRGE